MRKDKLFTCLQSALLAFALGYGGAGCVITGFSIENVGMQELMLLCGIAAVFCSVCYTLKLGLLPICLYGLGTCYLWLRGALAYSVEALLNLITGYYALAYHWPSISWSGQNLSQVDLTLGLGAIAILVILTISWTVCRRKSAVFSVALACLPVCACAVVTDTVPHWPWVALFLLGLSVLLMSQLLRRRKTAEGNSAVLMTILPATLALMILFFAVPQEGYGQFYGGTMADVISGWVESFISTPGTQEQPNSQGGTVNLEQVGSRRESNTVVMEVTTEYNGLLYLRSYAYNTYNNNSWTNRDDSYSLPWPDLVKLEKAPQIKVETVYASPVVYTPYYSEELVNAPNGKCVENLGKKTFIFQFWDASGIDWSHELQFQPRPEYTQLPERTLQWAGAIVEKITDRTKYASQIAADIGRYVSGSAVYDLNAGRMPSGYDDFAHWFLTEADKGYCVHFATAATVLLRAAGIPARYVNGYLINTGVAETVEVQAKNSHAWVEYYVDGYGWMILEPTPSQMIWEQISVVEPVTKPGQSENTLSTQETDPSETTDEAEQTVPDITEPVRNDDSSSEVDMSAIYVAIKIFCWLLIAVCTVLGQWQLRLWIRKRRRKQGGINRQVICAWRELVYLSRIAGVKPDKTLFELAQKAKFSQYTLDEENLALFEKHIGQLVRILKQKPVHLRLIYRLVMAAY